MKSFAGLFLLAACMLGSTQGEICASPSVKATSYTPSDASTLTHMAYVAEFTLTCSNKKEGGVPLYVDIEGSLYPVVRSQADATKYQVSWTKETKYIKTSAESFPVNIYDEEGYGALKRLSDRGEDVASVKPLVTVVVNYPGAFNGHYINSELLATLMAALVFYFAYASKTNLLA